MKNSNLLIAGLFFAVGFGIAYFQMGGEFELPSFNNEQNPPQTNSQIILSSHNPGDTISSPVIVTGQAVGNWYFEASFPIEVTDDDGNVLGGGVAQAQGDWMTTSFVPFTATVSFNPGTNTQGQLVLKKDNPSGEPANDDSISIPVQF